jgi:hypothetical protein
MLLWLVPTFCLLDRYLSTTLPPSSIPDELYPQYTLNSTIPVELLYVDDTDNGSETHFRFPSTVMNNYKRAVEKRLSKLSEFFFFEGGVQQSVTHHNQLSQLSRSDWVMYGLISHRLKINGSNACIFGSMEPYYELSLLTLGAMHVTTIEYNNLTYMHEQMTTKSKFDFDTLYHSTTSGYRESFDLALSISAFDHDGLGRYGDPLNPEGDLEAMDRAKSLLKPGGVLILTLPIGPDLVVFNLLRRYGEIRLPMMLRGWVVVDRLFWDEARLNIASNYRQSYEPIFILQKPHHEETTLLHSMDELSSSNGAMNLEYRIAVPS